jgi:hypothetical protein
VYTATIRSWGLRVTVLYTNIFCRSCHMVHCGD